MAVSEEKLDEVKYDDSLASSTLLANSSNQIAGPAITI